MMLTISRHTSPDSPGHDAGGGDVNQFQQLILQLMEEQRPPMSRADLARAAGMAKATVSNILTTDEKYATRHYRPATIEKLATALRVNPAILYEAAATAAGYDVTGLVEIQDPDLRHLVTLVEEDGTDEQKEWLRDVLRGLVRRLPETDRTGDEDPPRGG